MRSFKIFCLSLFFFVVSACATIDESSNQFITFETIGAQDAKCHVYVDKLRYQVFPPQTINIKKSEKDMIVQCDAPGNRAVELTVPAMFSTRAVWGTPVGIAWDYATEALHHYPSLIAIDFTQTEIKPFDLPKHNNKDIRQPETYDLEEFNSSTPRLNSDKDKIITPIIRRGQEVPSEYQDEYIEINPEENKSDSKSELLPATEEPQNIVPEAGDATAEPLSLFPGQ
ncbi:MAG: hypothetical protein GC137_01790 [Alphaproteobacteria bacterium]|nr:hypothetical protein [Alphaproteobacteria bacterium]